MSLTSAAIAATLTTAAPSGNGWLDFLGGVVVGMLIMGWLVHRGK